MILTVIFQAVYVFDAVYNEVDSIASPLQRR
jgi:hypothetical protein